MQCVIIINTRDTNSNEYGDSFQHIESPKNLINRDLLKKNEQKIEHDF